MARERALAMAQADWYADRITEDQVIPRARQYEAYLLSRPVCLFDLVSVVKSWIRARHAVQANGGKGSAEEVNRLADRVFSAEAEMERLVG